MVATMFTSLQRLAESLVRKEKREDLKLLAQSYVNALKNEAKKPGRCGLLICTCAESGSA